MKGWSKVKNQKCVKCNHYFSYKERVRANFNSNSIKCKDCRSTYKILFRSKLFLFIVLMSLLLFEHFISRHYDIALSVFIVLALFLLFFISPFFAQYNSKPVEPIQKSN